MNISSLADYSFNELFEAFSEAFADYETQWNKTQLHAMLQRRGFDAKCSFAAVEAERIVAFTFNGIGNFNGKRSAYDTGTGTLKKYRGQGMASQIFTHSLPYLREACIEQYVLEVLQHNTAAVSVYQKQGFNITREFYYSNQSCNLIQNPLKQPASDYEIKPFNVQELPTLSHFRDFVPSWQNDFASLLRANDTIHCYILRVEGETVGYVAFEPASGDIAQLAIRPDLRRQGYGSLLLQKALDENQSDIVKVINTETTNEPLRLFLQAKNIPSRGKQFEMILPLNEK
ncbi:MAG: GNAT family N-acetyltransferase [Odoribacter sp.]|nr:GNAT family N-acetyltransferase [Odoribacter sp.]